MLKLKTLLLTTLMLVTPIVITQPAAALFGGSKESACQGVNFSDTGTCDPASGNTLTNVLRTALQVFSIVVGIVAVLMLIVGGLKFIMSQGDSSQVATARNTILYAIAGLVVVFFAQFIVRFVLTRTVGCPAGQERDKTGACVAKP